MDFYIDMATLEVVTRPRRPKRDSYDYKDLDGQKHTATRNTPRDWTVQLSNGCTAHFHRRMDAKAFIETQHTEQITGQR